MAESYLDIKNSINEGAASLPLPKPNDGCGTGSKTTNPSIDLGLDIPDTSAVTDGINNAQNIVDEFGNTVMQVLEEIGAFIPTEFRTPASDSLPEKENGLDAISDITQASSRTGNGQTMVEGTGDEGQSYKHTIWTDGTAIIKDTDGSIVLNTAKSPPENHRGGRFQVGSQGTVMLDVGEALVIQVKNANKLVDESSKGRSKKDGGTAVSLYADGTIEIHSTTGDLNIGATGNVNIIAGKKLVLEGNDVSILAGNPPDTKTSSPSETGGDKYAGTIFMGGSDVKIDSTNFAVTKKTEYQKVDYETAISMAGVGSTLGIKSFGSMEVSVAGDLWEKIGMRKRTDLYSSLIPAIPGTTILDGQRSGYIIKNDGLPLGGIGVGIPEDLAPLSIPPVLKIENGLKGTGGFMVRSKLGSIDMMTTKGDLFLANENTALASFLTLPPLDKASKTVLSVLKLKVPGVYLASTVQNIDIFSPTLINLYNSAVPIPLPQKFCITICPAKINIQCVAGVYLN